MKKLLLLLLIPALSFGQTNNNERSRDQYLKVVGKPTIAPATANSYAVDFVNKKVYRSTSTSASSWVEETHQGIRDSYFGIKGDKGDPGKDGVCPSCPPSGGGVFPFHIVINNGTDNRIQVQAAVDETYISGKPIFLIGKDFKMSAGVKVPKDIRFLSVDGGAELTATNSNPFTFFYSDVPANVREAEDVYTNRRMIFRNIKLVGMNQAQIGFDLQCSEGLIINFVEFHSLKLNGDFAFALRSDLDNNESVNCIDGLKVTSAYGKYPDATIENAAPNGTTIRNYRFVGASNSNVAVRIADCSECLIENIVLEGHKMNIGIDWDCVSPTSTPANIDRIHWEAASPAGIVVIRIKSSTMTHVINNPNMIKPSMMVEVVVTSGGFPNVKFTNVSNQRVYFDDVNPILKSAVGVGWKFDNCDHPFVAYKMPKIFTGVAMTNSCVRENGLSRWCIVNPPN